MIKYRFDLLRDGKVYAQLTEISNIRFGFVRNDFRRCSFDHNGNNLDPIVKEFLIKGSELRVYRKAEFETNLKVVWAGEILSVNKTINSKNEKKIQCVVRHWGEVFLKARYITKSYVATEESEIAWDLIDTTQTDIFSGAYTLDQVDMGFTQGVLETTNNVRDREYLDDEILKLLQQLANVLDDTPNPQVTRGLRLSPDLKSNKYLEFSYYGSLYSVDSGVIYTDATIDTIVEYDSLDDFLNRVNATGATGTAVQSATTINQNILNFYKLRVGYVSKSNITTDSSLLESAQDELAKRIDSPKIYKVSLINNDPFVGKYREGDIITIKYQDNEDFIIIDNLQFMVLTIDISYGQDGKERVILDIAETVPATVHRDGASKLISATISSGERVTELEKQL